MKARELFKVVDLSDFNKITLNNNVLRNHAISQSELKFMLEEIDFDINSTSIYCMDDYEGTIVLNIIVGDIELEVQDLLIKRKNRISNLKSEIEKLQKQLAKMEN